MANDTCIIEGCAKAAAHVGMCGGHYRTSKPVGPCSVAECDRLAVYGRQGMCRSHYSVRHGKRCSAEGCTNLAARQHGQCERHYRLALAQQRPCSIAGCSGRYQARGLCGAHYVRLRTKGILGGPIENERSRSACSFGECREPAAARRLCKLHYYRMRRGIPMDRPIRQSPGQPLPPDKYPRVKVGGKHVAAHRHVMEQHLGRPLRSDEHVHHVNGDRHDFRLSNLELWTTSHPYGQRASDHLAWARRIVALYGDDFDQGRLL